ncbi:uncharacterized protein K02A2.6-like [Corythoichthys intestinalis]|uniref:uncharacterized protein K02A2.6-like n=1 Tax=Corythoichthys intestinalis TaxID=161448 RepID=UPI0025A5C3B8|nr:uncharacterized protein K02A2.6-like [Corythoichthys intestinalis]
MGRLWINALRVNWLEVRQQSDGSSQLQVILDKNEEVFREARTVQYAIRDKVEADLDALVKSGVLEPVNTSEWATPIVPVPKKNGGIRTCADFKVTLNPVLCVEQYPLPLIDDLFAGLSGGQKFSKIDLNQAYLQMHVDEESREWLTINTHKGLFRYCRLPFGITSAPALFQRAMDQILSELPGVQCYLDDILCTGADEEHLRNLDAVLKRLRQYGLRVRKDKCEFLRPSVEYLGHVIDHEGLLKAPSKTKAIVDATAPENVSQLRSFLGLLNYYRRFIPNLASLLKPLHELLCKDVKWKWTNECNKAFRNAKNALISSEVLTHFNPSYPIQLACDASPYGVGSVISHVFPNGDERPIAFASRTLNKAESNYAQLEREALSIIFGVRKFHQYLYGRKFTLLKDHRPLTTILGPLAGIPSLAAARLQRWALLLSAHSYDIKYRKSDLHCNADGLSRLPLPVTKHEPTSVDIFYFRNVEHAPISASQVKRATRNDPDLSVVMDMVIKGQTKCENTALKPFLDRRWELSVQSGCLLWGRRVIVPQSLRAKMLAQLHAGHSGIVKMKEMARSYFWWPGLDKQIEETVKSCSSCQKIAIDAHSKWPEVAIMKSTTSEKAIEKLGEMFSRFGAPAQLVSDNGPQFVSKEMVEFLQANGVQHIKSAPYHPATNGLAERFVQTLKHALKASQVQSTLHQRLHEFLLKYRTSVHATTKVSPASLMFSREIRTGMGLLKPPTLSEIVQMDQRKQVKYRDLHSKNRVFAPGDSVLARSYQSKEKWAPATIIAQTGPVSYTVQTADGVWRRHVDQLLGTPDTTPELSIDCDDTGSVTIPEMSSLPDVPKIPEMSSLPDVSNPNNPAVMVSNSTNAQTEPETVSEPVSTSGKSEVTVECRYPARDRRPPDRLDL